MLWWNATQIILFHGSLKYHFWNMISLFKEGNYKLKKTLHKIQVCNCMYHLCSIIHFFSETILKTSTSEGIILHADKMTSISSTTNIPSALITNSFEFNDYSTLTWNVPYPLPQRFWSPQGCLSASAHRHLL